MDEEAFLAARSAARSAASCSALDAASTSVDLSLMVLIFFIRGGFLITVLDYMNELTDYDCVSKPRNN